MVSVVTRTDSDGDGAQMVPFEPAHTGASQLTQPVSDTHIGDGGVSLKPAANVAANDCIVWPGC